MRFNYVVTIHNSEQHLRYVLDAIRKVREDTSEVYLCLDGCTDGSKEICDEYPEFHQIITLDIRETAVITNALKTIPQIGYNLIIQDDVVLQDPLTEEHIKECYIRFPNIGVLGFRHGANFETDVLTNDKHASEVDLIQNKFQPQLWPIPNLEEGFITERQFVYKSPICVSSEVVNKLGGYDKRFEPIAHDDTEYCVRATKEGYRNFVISMKLMQPVQWGGSRRNPYSHLMDLKMHKDHMDLIRELYPDELLKPRPSLDNIQIWTT